ncbi:Glu-tRNA(Gln) amidotransferase GatDE subunit E, partial [Candidatus Woesearchaeota archaeon]
MAKITCGLEIHQQLDTGKLFCKCPSKLNENPPEYTIERRLRAVIGESGEVDPAAAAQAMRARENIYECHDENVCLIDLDEEPPRPIREEALKIAIQAGKLLKARFVDEAQVMRKIVIDGSNTTGFQRTTLIAMDGSIQSTKGPIRIPTVILEEDSARIIEERESKSVYRLDRLGIPLLEISTAPEITSPEQCQEVARELGLILRSLPVKRGQGTIRQDVNVSIKGGARVEIKGAQDLKLLPTLVKLEAQRQENLIKIKKELAKRKAKITTSKPKDITHLLERSNSKIINSALARGGKVLSIKLPGFSSLLGIELQPGRRLGSELSDRAKWASSVKGLFHSDELPNYGIEKEEVRKIKQALLCKEEDAFILVAAQEDEALRAINAAVKRAQESIKGVPKEVRKAMPDGTTRFIRPMPGASRMYPETDVLPIKITKEKLSVELPETIQEKTKRYKKILPEDIAKALAKSQKTKLFDLCIKKFKSLKPAYIAEVILTTPAVIKREYGVEINPSDQDFEDLFSALERGKIAKESIID